MPVPKLALTRKKPTASAKITNGKVVLADIDGRSAYARRYRDLVTLHAEDLGGLETLSQAQQSLVRRAATIEVELERQESVLANGGSIDLDAFNRATGGLRRLFETLGLRRVRKDVTPTLHAIVSRHRQRREDREAREERGESS